MQMSIYPEHGFLHWVLLTGFLGALFLAISIIELVFVGRTNKSPGVQNI